VTDRPLSSSVKGQRKDTEGIYEEILREWNLTKQVVLEISEHKEFLKKMDCGYQFSHTLSEQIGGQLKAGFILTNIEDDTGGEGKLHEMNIPTFIMTRAVKL